MFQRIASRVPKSAKLTRQFATCNADMPFPGSPAGLTTKLEVTAPSACIPVYRVMDNDGKILEKNYNVRQTDAELVDMYKYMLKLNNLDKIFYDAQRQGRISFYMTSFGEEGTHIGCASEFTLDDMIFAQYRETGVLMHRGFSLEQFAHQCFSNQYDLGKGRQMPVHYGSRELNWQTISSPLGTQLPQAVGAAYAYKRDKKNAVVVCFFGEGAASEGDVHAGMNFSATLEAPVLFFCRNNGYAISTPVEDQYRGDGIAARALALGVHVIRVDGNDILAVADATKAAKDYILANNKPCLVETYSYRAGHHSTSDDSSRYRTVEEINHWQTKNNPIFRFRAFLENKGIWNEKMEEDTQTEYRTQVLEALGIAETAKKPAISQLFEDVYDVMPHHLQEQSRELQEHLAKYGEHYHLGEYVANEDYVNPGEN